MEVEEKSESNVKASSSKGGHDVSRSISKVVSAEKISAAEEASDTPALLVLGMAGSGKSTLTAALQSHFSSPYIVNLDPAVINAPFSSNIDIQDTINYHKIMNDYKLGPNGAILTSLNLFATRFDQVLDLLHKRSKELSHIVIDTPGQIETFTWSASGDIISNALACQHPTIVLYAIDTVRSAAPMTFISNMLHACSIMYKTRLPMVLVFTKSDACPDDVNDDKGEDEKKKGGDRPCGNVVRSWLRDFDAFERAIGEEMGFRGTLARSMALALSEFYEEIRSVAVSAMTGEGLGELERKVREAVEEFEKEYKPILEERKKKKEEIEQKRVEEEMKKLKNDRRDEHVFQREEKDEVDIMEDEREYKKFLRDVERLNTDKKDTPASSEPR